VNAALAALPGKISAKSRLSLQQCTELPIKIGDSRLRLSIEQAFCVRLALEFGGKGTKNICKPYYKRDKN